MDILVACGGVSNGGGGGGGGRLGDTSPCESTLIVVLKRLRARGDGGAGNVELLLLERIFVIGLVGGSGGAGGICCCCCFFKRFSNALSSSFLTAAWLDGCLTLLVICFKGGI